MSSSSPAVSRPGRRTATLHYPTTNGSKLFNQEDEIRLLKTLANHPSSPSLPAAGLEESMGERFTPSQLSHKIRRLRLKYHKMARSKSAIKSRHDSELFEISRRIWGKGKSQQQLEEGLASPKANGGETMEEEAAIGGVDECDLGKFPVLLNECERSLGNDGGAWREVLKCVEDEQLRMMNEKLVLLRCEEAAFMTKKAELIRELTGMILRGMATASLRKNSGC